MEMLSALNPRNSIAARLALWFIVFGAAPAICLVAIYMWFKGDVEHAFRAPVESTAVALGDTIDRNLFERYGDVQAFGVNGLAHDPLNWRKPGADNPLVRAMDAYMVNYGLYALMILVDPTGQVLAVNSADNTGKPLETAALYATNFAEATWFKDAMAGKFLEGDGLSGTAVQQPAFDPIVASIYGTDGYTMAFSAPVKDSQGQLIGVWANFADFGLVDQIVATFHGDLVKRGLLHAEITVLDNEGRVIVDYDPAGQGWSEYARNPDVIGKLNLVEMGVGPAAAAVTRGESGVMMAMHARKGIEQAAGFARTDGAYSYPGLGWSVLVRTPDSEINAVSAEVFRDMLIALGIALVIVAVLARLIGRGVSAPIQAMTGSMRVLAGGDSEVAIPGQQRSDEIGAMAASVQVFKDNMIEGNRLRNEQQAEQQRQLERAKRMETAIVSFDKSISEVVKAVDASSSELQATAQSMSAMAEEASRQSTAVAAASEQTTQNVQTVAAATEELSASIREISNQVTESARIAGEAVTQAEDTNAKVKSLSEAAQKIGDVVTLINEIASQTNLLALNATIEAARAGEAGKGFAVVASEVKNLATQTAKATEEIAGQVRAIQDSTDSSAQAIGAITQTINRVNEIATAIASAVEEQGAATQEISRNVQQAAQGTTEVSANISGVTQASQQTSAGSTQVLGAAGELTKNGETLRMQVESFLQTVRSA